MNRETFIEVLDSRSNFSISGRQFTDHVRETLSSVPIDHPISTPDLATRLLGTAEHSTTRVSLYNKLKYFSKGSLVDCMSHGAKVTKLLYGKVTVYRPRLWHKSDGIVRAVYCKSCGHELESKES